MVSLTPRSLGSTTEPLTVWRTLGVLDPLLSVSPLLNSPEAAKDTPARHFSAFPLTSHMHTPTLRLVSLHPSLSVTLSFIRVPEIHETFTRRVFFARASTVKDVINTVVEDLGLAKTLPIPGAGTLEYVLEEVWKDGNCPSFASLCSSST